MNALSLLTPTHKKTKSKSKKEQTAPDTRISNPRFAVFMASRATHKVVFAGPNMDADIVRELKFDLFEVSGKCKKAP